MARRNHLLVATLCALVIAPAGTRAQPAPAPPAPTSPVPSANLTANELFEQARTLFGQKNFAAALEAYEKFKADYGSSPEAKQALYNSLYPVAICYVQLLKFQESIPAINEALAATPPLPQQQQQDLTFWLGVAQMQQEDYPAARAAFEKFITLFPPGAEKMPHQIRSFPAVTRIPEARSQIGMSYILEENFQAAADFYKQLKSTLPPETRGRAVIFQLNALEKLGDNDSAMQVVEEEYPNMADIPQLVSFQTLILQLGNRFLEQGQFRKAIACLQRVWQFDRLVRHQENRLAALEQQLKAAESSASDPYAKITYSRLVKDVGRELGNFKKVQGFDTALRFRLAMAYLQMKRYREAALVMDKMLDELPPDKLSEQAAVNIVRCWTAIGDWPQAIAAAKKFVEKFPDSTLVPEVLYMEGEALLSSLRYDEAAAVFESISAKYPNSKFGPEALFMRGFALLQAEKNMEAAAAFENFLSAQPKHPRADAATYWRGMAFSYDKQFDQAREAMDAYLEKFPDGRHRGQATFRKAYCSQQLERYGSAIDELHAYLEKFPGEAENNEARILLGNALMNEGYMEDGIAVFKEIPSTDQRLYAEGVFRTAEGLKLLEEYERYRELMEKFHQENPTSPRVAEAISNLGWYWRQQEHPEKARELYWQAIAEYGNDPAIRSVDDLFPALARLYRGPEDSKKYLALLRDLSTEAESSGKKTLLLRLLCAQAAVVKKSDPALAQSLLIQAATIADVRKDNPALLVDIANALLAAGRTQDGTQMLRDALRWNPRAIQKDGILAGLGDAELLAGNEKAALEFYTRFERENLGTPIFAPTMLKKAKLHAKNGENEKARHSLNELLKADNVRSDLKAEALYTMGELHMQENDPKKAIPYFIQVFNMYGRWKPWVAKSYLRSGEAFEKIPDTTSARRTYSEFLDKPELAEFPEAATARERLQALGGPLPKTNPASEAAPQAAPEPAPAQG
jgi:tetratricopeptide (TPR) repeat protein